MERKNKKLKDPDFFIVGLQKSGTYGISAFLDAHPQIRCLPNHPIHNYTKGKTGADEGRIFDMLASIDKDDGEALKNSFLNHHGGFFANIAGLIGKANKEELYEAVKNRYKEWFEFQNSGNKPIVGDKTTEYVFHLDMIDDFFPNAKKLCIIRNPKDRIVSWNFHQIRKGRKNGEKIDDEFIKNYLENQIKKEYESMLNYKGFIHCFTYEALKNNPKKVLVGILSYLDADLSEEIMDKMIEEASFENLKKKEIDYFKKENISQDIKHYRKGVVGEWKNYLSEEQVKMIDAIIDSLQKKVFEKYNVIMSDYE